MYMILRNPFAALCVIVYWLALFHNLDAHLTHGLSFSPSSHPQSWLYRCRDIVIQKIWRVPENQASSLSVQRRSEESGPAPTWTSRYERDVVLRFEFTSAEDARALADAADILFLDVWEFTEFWADIRLCKDVLPSLLGLLPESLQNARPLIHDLGQTILESFLNAADADATRLTLEATGFSSDYHRPKEDTNIFFQKYQPLSIIVPWMRLLRSLYPSHVRTTSIGTTYEGREIHALRVGVHPTNAEKPLGPRKTIIVAGGSHAREWISTSTVCYVAYTFITAYGRDRDITNILETFDFLFIPTLNPDGYAYTFETDRLWRKNRQSTNLRFCKGFDLDKAYGFHWGAADASDGNPCSESFPGESPFEAVEARRFRDFIHNQTKNGDIEIRAFLDLHSYSQQILYPYSYSCTATPPDLENLEEVAVGMAKAIRLTHGEKYDIASACEGSVPFNVKSTAEHDDPAMRKYWPRMETGGGSALDWMYNEMKSQMAFQIKLRDTGSYGFLLPSSEIVPTGKEALNAIQHLGHFLADHVYVHDRSKGDNGEHTTRAPTELQDGCAYSRSTVDQDLDDRNPASLELR